MMHPYPHIYTAAASGQPEGAVGLTSPGLPDIATASPPEFGGPGGVWSPENLLCASLADCFILTFRSISRAAKFEWADVQCRVEGVLDRVERVSQFVRYTTFAKLTVRSGSDLDKARDLLARAERGCLITNSLRGSHVLDAEIVVSDE